MKNYRYSKIIVILIVSGLLMIAFSDPIASSEKKVNDVIHVDWRNSTGPWYGSEQYPYKTISQALENFSSHETNEIYVHNGTYRESLIITSAHEGLVLRGDYDNFTTICPNHDSDGSYAISVDSENVNIENFNITNEILEGPAIHIFDSKKITVDNCNIYGNIIGVRLQGSNGCEVLNSYFFENVIGIILWWKSDSNIIKGNDIFYSHLGGIVISMRCSANQILENNIENSSAYGIHISLSNFNLVMNNNIENRDENIFTGGLFNLFSINFGWLNWWGHYGPNPPFPKGEIIFWPMYFLSMFSLICPFLLPFFLMIFPWRPTRV